MDSLLGPSKPVQAHVDIKGIPTNLLFQQFSDKSLIIATQYRKLGTLTLVSEDASMPNMQSIRTHTAKVILGPDDTITQVMARRFASTCERSKPVLVSAALKDTSPDMVTSICEELKKIIN